MSASETSPRGARSPDLTVKHRYVAIDGVRIFYREAVSGRRFSHLVAARLSVILLPIPQLHARAGRPLAADRAGLPGLRLQRPAYGLPLIPSTAVPTSWIVSQWP
jgi:hypothetical protein